MDAKRWEKIESLYHAALQVEAERREDFLQEACEGDNSLLGEVKTLLMFQEKNNTFLENPALNQAAKLLVTHQNQLAFGQVFANYKVLTLLGAGGMGEVYLAEDVQLGRKVALKVLPVNLTYNPNLVQRFQKEARAASVLNHPNILTIYEVGQDNTGINYIAAEYIEGETLRQILSSGKELDLHRILDIAIQTASALSAAHRAGVIHRDIKPQNIMVREDGYVKVLDFGIAKLIENKESSGEHSSLRTDTGMILGTANYMSPEQARGLKVDARTDLWSLGVTLYELVTRQAPFTGVTTTDVIVSILEREPPPILEIAPDAPPELARIINKCLAKDAAERYQNAAEVITDLQALQSKTQPNSILKFPVRCTSDNAKGITDENNRTTAKERAEKNQQKNTGNTRTNGIFYHVARRPYIAAAAILLTFAVGTLVTYTTNGFKYLGGIFTAPEPVPNFRDAKINRLTNTGNVVHAHVSPDGKYVAYVAEEAGQHSLWVRQIAAPPPRKILASTGDLYRGLTFSPDSNFIYYTIHEKTKGKGVLYSISVLGSEPRRILEDVDSPVAFSPDGKSFAFVRDDNEGEVLGYALMIANVATTELRKLAVHRDPDFFSYDRFTWSGDGKSIIIPSIKASDVSTKYMHLIEVTVADGSEKVLGSKHWKEIGSVSWHGKDNLVLTGIEESSPQPQIYQLSYSSGEVIQITRDLDGYRDVSTTVDGKKIVSVQFDQSRQIWTAPAEDPNNIEMITSGNGEYFLPTWTPDKKIVFSTDENGSKDIWQSDRNGGGLKQLTFNSISNNPKVSPDNRYVVFVTKTNGKSNIWRMDRDGSNPIQLTNGDEDSFPFFSADSKLVYYTAFVSGNWFIHKVSVEGGSSEKFLRYPSLHGAMSKDGKAIICHFVDESTNAEWGIGIFSSEDGRLLYNISNLTEFNRKLPRWMSDKSFSYINLTNGIQNLWMYNLDEKIPKQITNFRSADEILYYDWSFDDSNLLILRGTKIRDVIYLNSNST
jgi:eukaryotic-like serine/threonine-protein kinase